MTKLGLRLVLQLRDDALSQHLAQLDAPLVERVDVPDSTLREDGMLVESDELAERSRREAIGEDRIGWAIALEDPVRHKPVLRALSLDLFRCLAKCQCLRLSEHISQEHVV